MRYLNIGLVAHVDAGKTTVTEQLLYETGVLRQVGSVDSGTTMTDFLDIERSRGISVKASSASFTVGDLQVNLIDTPGHVDFAAEVERSLMVLDVAVLVISAVEGVQSHTELLLDALRAVNTPTILFINKIDRVGSRVEEILNDLKEKYHLNVLNFSQYENEGEKTCTSKAYAMDEAFYEASMDVLTEQDEELMLRYLDGEVLSEEEWKASIKSAFLKRELFPVFCGSAMYGIGVKDLLSYIIAYGGQPKNRKDEELSGIVYRITHDKTMGRIAHVRLFGGSLQNRDDLVLKRAGEVERGSLETRSLEGEKPLEDGLNRLEPQKISQIRRYTGSKFLDLGVANAGDVVALCGLSKAKVSDIIGTVADELHYDLTVPFLKVRAIPEKAEQITNLLQAFYELEAEDPKLFIEYIQEKKEINISTTGSIQLEILQALLKERYGLGVTFTPPTIIYKETPTRKGHGFDAYTLPKPCWAVIALDIEPAPRGSGLHYRSVVANKDIFYRYQNHIEIAVPKALKQGLYNWEVTDLNVTLVGGNHHVQHTHPLDFFLATPIAVMKGLVCCGTTLLEPMQRMKIIAGEEYLGKVLGDMIHMRAIYDSPIITQGKFCLEARVPAATSYDYGIRLASLTSGKGILSLRFDGYEPCPLELGAVAERRGINPLDRDKWILAHRNAIQGEFLF